MQSILCFIDFKHNQAIGPLQIQLSLTSMVVHCIWLHQLMKQEQFFSVLKAMQKQDSLHPPNLQKKQHSQWH